MDDITRKPKRSAHYNGERVKRPELYSRRPVTVGRSSTKLISDFGQRSTGASKKIKLTIEDGVIKPVLADLRVKEPENILRPIAPVKPEQAKIHGSPLQKPDPKSRAGESLGTKAKILKRSHKQKIITLAAVAMIVFGAYTSLIGWRANHASIVQAQKLTQQANQSNSSAENLKALSTLKPTNTELANYAVAPDMPRYLDIPSISVHARILSVGIKADGALGTPNDIYDTAWYNESAQPGADGAMLIDGHLDGYNAAGVFWNLHKLTAGAVIKVVRGDDKAFTYKVVKNENFSTSKLNMTTALTSVNPKLPGLNLITCDGDYMPGAGGYNKRTIVFAQLAS